ncbi:hypothetical protein ACFSSF_13080 [Dietzia aerolata]|uniref:hypothetical protein n=1 Tax=Dietzia aerolata TaxID=595984 RepID=UPI0036389133
MGTRHRRLAVPTVAAVGLIAALALAGCGGGTGSSSGGATTGTPPTGTSQTATSPTPAESGPAESGPSTSTPPPCWRRPATSSARSRCPCCTSTPTRPCSGTSIPTPRAPPR